MKPFFALMTLACSAALLSWNPAVAAGAAAGLAVCVDEDNPPFSSHVSRNGIDLDIARAIATRLGRDVEFTWITIPMRGGLGKALKASIEAGRCDLFMGLPEDEDTAADLAKRHLSATQPYLTLGYLLVSAPGSAPMTLAAARKAPRIGAVTATPADLYLHKENFHRVPYGNNGELMQAIQSREIDAALIWSPAFGALRSTDQGRQPVIAKEQSPDHMLRTNLLIAVGTAQTALAQEVNAALEQMRADGSIRSTAEAQGLPWLAP